MTGNILEQDLDHILDHTRDLWGEVRGNRIFISGGTGFFGCWLLESFAWANERLGLHASAVVLTRNPAAFERRVPHLAMHPAIRLHCGDIRNFDFPDGKFRFLIHAATETSVRIARDTPLEMLDTIVQGTRRTLDFARHCEAAKLLLTSSGAVYGTPPPHITHLREDFPGAPDPADPRSVYGEGKRLAELLCSLYAGQFGMECKIARCFAAAGPYLPTDVHFAFGSFIRDVMGEGPIRVSGDGTPLRSYLYAADLAIWLWTILFRGQSGRPYNVGSERAVSISELAHEVAKALNPGVKVEVAGAPDAGFASQRYVPSTEAARTALGLREFVELKDAIIRTSNWRKNTAKSGGI